MAVLNVNPTRMELTNLKRKLTTARRGHKLLKDKRDELMRRFMELVRENKELRKKVENGIAEANRYIAVARSVMSDAWRKQWLGSGHAEMGEHSKRSGGYHRRLPA